MTALTSLSDRFRTARLYLCTDARQDQGDLPEFLAAAFAGGVDVVQIRQKHMSRDAELAALEVARDAARRHGGIVSVNDSPALAQAFGADVLHLGQTDGPADRARAHLHQWALIGRSTHTPDQTDAAVADADVDYFCVGPVYATPTKPDYVPAGLDLVSSAARTAPVADLNAKPWFAIGGIGLDTLDEVLAAGARRVVVVRAITAAADPQAAARAIADRLRAAWDDDPSLTDYAFKVAQPRPR